MRWPVWSASKTNIRLAFANDPGRRPSRHCHAVRGIDESESLSRGGHRLSAHPSAAVADGCVVGKTLVSSSMIDRVVKNSAASFPKFRWFQMVRARVCSTARSVLAAKKAPVQVSCGSTELFGRPTRTARSWICSRRKSRPCTGKDPGEHFRELTAEFGMPYYTRIDAPATPEQKAKLQRLSARRRERIRIWQANRLPLS